MLHIPLDFTATKGDAKIRFKLLMGGGGGMHSLERHIAELLARAYEQESKAIGHILDWDAWRAQENADSFPPDYLVYGDDEFIVPFEHTLTSLHESIICYLDAKRQTAYLSQFYEKFGQKFDAHAAASNFSGPDFWDAECRNVFLINLRRFLVPLGISADLESYAHIAGIAYLDNILRNTARIVNQMKVQIGNESDVYSAVKIVIESVFPSSRKGKSAFHKTAQEYKPDILIPEIKTAVEYKYATTESRLTKIIDDIHADVKGYTGDPDYERFYAVFYVSTDLWGLPKFKQIWKEKDFPDNWKGLYIVGA